MDTTPQQTAPPLDASQPHVDARTGLALGALLLILLTILVAELDAGISAAFKAQGIDRNPLEYPLTAVAIGLITGVGLRLSGWLDDVKGAFRSELFLKIGLVILGATVSFGNLLAIGLGGLAQGLVMVTSVFFFTWWLSGRLGLPPTLRAVMSTAVSVCGVSAAIAAAGAVLAKKEEVSYIAALVILTALPLMVIMPPTANALGLSDTVAGAWFGGNIDTTAAVVGAGTIHGDEAQEVAAIVKLTQNVLIGFVAFGLALYFALVVERDTEQRPSPSVIWQRFPKFVIGFVLVSILASIGLFSDAALSDMKLVQKWAFTLAFICIGIEFTPGAVQQMGWKPIGAYGAATVFNTVLALIVASIIFGALGAG